MAIRSRTKAKILTSFLILLAFLSPLPLIQASRHVSQEESLKTVVRATKVEIKGAEANVYARLHSHKGVSQMGLEESASLRQVPTGPDPLHHNQIPNGP